MILNRYQLVYMEVRYNQKSKKLDVLKMDSYYMDTYAQVAAVAYCKHELGWKVQFRKSTIFTHCPAWNHTNISSFAVMIKIEKPKLVKLFYGYGFSFNLTERQGHFKQSIVELIDFLAGNSKQFVDISLNASKWHKILSMPDGYQILQPGDIIQATDLEYHTNGRTEGFFFSPSHYNVGKLVQKPQDMNYVKDGQVYKSHKDLPRPFVVRRTEL